MQNEANEPTPPAEKLPPLPYHQAIVDYLKREEGELWRWFASNQVRKEHNEQVRLELLKSNYRIEPPTQPRLYELAREVLGKLGLAVPVTFYQASNPQGLNAALAYSPGEAHVILVGSIATALAEPELAALLGHELAHFHFFDRQESEFLVASELLTALNNDASSPACYRETARLYRLYTEIYADRGALLVTDDPLIVIAKLLKAETGLTDVSAESYLRQAEEILSKGSIKAGKETHPETFIRAKAIHLFAQKGSEADSEILNLIEGPSTLHELDVLQQKSVAAITQKLIGHFLAPAWFQTEPVLAHARSFFPEFTATTTAALDEETVESIKCSAASIQDYYCFVLLDFVTVDRQLEETPLAAALLLADRLGMRERLVAIAAKELAITKKRFAVVERDAAKILDQANKSVSKP